MTKEKALEILDKKENMEDMMKAVKVLGAITITEEQKEILRRLKEQQEQDS